MHAKAREEPSTSATPQSDKSRKQSPKTKLRAVVNKTRSCGDCEKCKPYHKPPLEGSPAPSQKDAGKPTSTQQRLLALTPPEPKRIYAIEYDPDAEQPLVPNNPMPEAIAATRPAWHLLLSDTDVAPTALFEIEELLRLCAKVCHSRLEACTPGIIVGTEPYPDVNAGPVIFLGTRTPAQPGGLLRRVMAARQHLLER